MAIVEGNSVIYKIIFGEHQGRSCVPRVFKEVKGMVGVAFNDVKTDEIIFVKPEVLSPLETPGWLAQENHQKSYGFAEFAREKNNGSNLLRTDDIAQPRTLKPCDILASKEIVTQPSRSGYNSSCLVCLDKTGWVELAPRLPLALLGNKNYKFPAQLEWWDELATGCIVKGWSISQIGWVSVCLDEEHCEIKIPACIPLALGTGLGKC
jgi:hypothetical protein